MVKTRSQTGNITIKKEEEEESCKPTLDVASVTMTTRSKITKKKPPIINNRPLPAQQVKVEDDTDTKSLLQSSSKYSKRGPKPRISQEQINQLIHYIVNGNMSIVKASRKVNMSKCSGSIYYKLYKDDPEKKTPVLRDQTPKMYMQEQIGNLIRYINNDKMTLKEASVKANMTYSSAYYRYNRYLKNPNHNIPVPQLRQCYTQAQKKKFIGYIVRDKMSIIAASKKAKIKKTTAHGFYRRYFKAQDPNIARPSHITKRRSYTQEQIKELISYIVDDKMNIAAASRKADFNKLSAAKYYRQYLNDNNMKIPAKRAIRYYTQDQKSELIKYIVDDKMTITAASKKVNMPSSTSRIYYHQYLKDQKRDGPT